MASVAELLDMGNDAFTERAHDLMVNISTLVSNIQTLIDDEDIICAALGLEFKCELRINDRDWKEPVMLSCDVGYPRSLVDAYKEEAKNV